jgi:hypothetical protein
MLPKLKDWYADKPEGYEIIAVSIDSTKNDWQQKVCDLGIELWYNLSDLKGWDGMITEAYNIYATPTMFILNEDREIIAKPVTFSDLIRSLSPDIANQHEQQ